MLGVGATESFKGKYSVCLTKRYFDLLLLHYLEIHFHMTHKFALAHLLNDNRDVLSLPNATGHEFSNLFLVIQTVTMGVPIQ